MKYICDNCQREFEVDDNIEVNYCLMCGKAYIRKESDGLKQLARIRGTLNSVMDVVIHQDGHIELLDLKGEYDIDKNYEILDSKEITEVEYERLI